MKHLPPSDTPERRGLLLTRGPNGVYTAPDPGPEGQREAAMRAFPHFNVEPNVSTEGQEEI